MISLQKMDCKYTISILLHNSLLHHNFFIKNAFFTFETQ
jgi:hypothetical protein